LKAHLFLGLLAAATIFGGGAQAYDGTWYRADFWSGEYPAGFTLTADVSIRIRLEPAPDAPPTVRCDLSRNATYHPWNGARIADRKLKFVSFTKIVRHEIERDHTAFVTREAGHAEAMIAFRRGDRWDSLAYLQEGLFLLRFRGEIYSGGQDILAVSKEVDESGDSAGGYDQWMRLVCDNGATGWLLLSDIDGQADFGAPNIIEYGAASDVSG
jgi:hypothetical protein